MNLIQSFLDNTQLPVLTAFLLGLAVAFHPCPLATNIAAMGYIARGIGSKRRVLMSGLVYTVGRMLAYSVLGAAIVLSFGGDTNAMHIANKLTSWGEVVLAPVLIIVGAYFLFSHAIHKHEHCPDVAARGRGLHGYWGSLLLGVLLALAFCPESGIVYFGMLMPLSLQAKGGILLPTVFAVATAVPSVLMAWGLAYGIGGSTVIRKRLSAVQKWINAAVGVVFICAGVFCLFH